MKSYTAFLLMTSLVVACSDGETTTTEPNPFYPPDAGSSESASSSGAGGATGCVVDSSCGACVTETRMPAVGIGDVLVFCSECGGDACSEHGDACESYGALCDVGGAPGVCTACCTGPDAHLRCSPL